MSPDPTCSNEPLEEPIPDDELAPEDDRVIGRALRMACGWRTKTIWLGLYGIERTSLSRRSAFLDRVERKSAGIR